MCVTWDGSFFPIQNLFIGNLARHSFDLPCDLLVEDRLCLNKSEEIREKKDKNKKKTEINEKRT